MRGASRLSKAGNLGRMWMDEIHFAPPGNHGFLVHTNQQWLPVVSQWCSAGFRPSKVCCNSSQAPGYITCTLNTHLYAFRPGRVQDVSVKKTKHQLSQDRTRGLRISKDKKLNVETRLSIWGCAFLWGCRPLLEAPSPPYETKPVGM